MELEVATQQVVAKNAALEHWMRIKRESVVNRKMTSTQVCKECNNHLQEAVWEHRKTGQFYRIYECECALAPETLKASIMQEANWPFVQERHQRVPKK